MFQLTTHTSTVYSYFSLAQTKAYTIQTPTHMLYERPYFLFFFEKPSELINWLNNNCRTSIIHWIFIQNISMNSLKKFNLTRLSFNSIHSNYKVGREYFFYFDYATPTFKTNGWKKYWKKRVSKKEKSIQMNTWTANIYTYRSKR